MRKPDFSRTSSPLARAASYLTIFVIAALAAEFFIYAANSPSIIPGLFIIVLSVMLGPLFISERNVLSRITSAATLLVLSTIALKFGHVPIASAILLVMIVGVAYLGALPLFHNNPHSKRQLFILGALVSIITLAFVAIFTYITTVLIRIAMS